MKPDMLLEIYNSVRLAQAIRRGATVRSCDDCSVRLPAYLADELAPTSAKAVAHHLETCAACRAEADGLQVLSARLRQSVQTKPAVLPAADLWQRVEAGIAPIPDVAMSSFPEPSSARSRRLQPRRLGFPLVVAGALVPACVATLFFWKMNDSGGVSVVLETNEPVVTVQQQRPQERIANADSRREIAVAVETVAVGSLAPAISAKATTPKLATTPRHAMVALSVPKVAKSVKSVPAARRAPSRWTRPVIAPRFAENAARQDLPVGRVGKEALSSDERAPGEVYFGQNIDLYALKPNDAAVATAQTSRFAAAANAPLASTTEPLVVASAATVRSLDSNTTEESSDRATLPVAVAASSPRPLPASAVTVATAAMADEPRASQSMNAGESVMLTNRRFGLFSYRTR